MITKNDILEFLNQEIEDNTYSLEEVMEERICNSCLKTDVFKDGLYRYPPEINICTECYNSKEIIIKPDFEHLLDSCDYKRYFPLINNNCCGGENLYFAHRDECNDLLLCENHYLKILENNKIDKLWVKKNYRKLQQKDFIFFSKDVEYLQPFDEGDDYFYIPISKPWKSIDSIVIPDEIINYSNIDRLYNYISKDIVDYIKNYIKSPFELDKNKSLTTLYDRVECLTGENQREMEPCTEEFYLFDNFWNIRSWLPFLYHNGRSTYNAIEDDFEWGHVDDEIENDHVYKISDLYLLIGVDPCYNAGKIATMYVDENEVYAMHILPKEITLKVVIEMLEKEPSYKVIQRLREQINAGTSYSD